MGRPDLPLPAGWAYAGTLFPPLDEAPMAPIVEIVLTPDLGCCALCCTHDEQHTLYPSGPEHEDC